MTLHPPPPLERAEFVVQGGFRVSDDPAVVLATLLGSCVAVCLHDPRRGLGGMNHFLLPQGREGQGDPRRYGVQAMELLINALLVRGAQRRDLVAKVFGGARMIPQVRDVGEENARFARAFLDREGIPIAAFSLGGSHARRLRFWPHAGRARMMLVTRPGPWPDAAPPPAPPPPAGAIDLFDP